MRRLGTALCEGEGLAFELTAPDGVELADLELAPDRRRHLFLIFKEALHNAVRHSGARRICARVSLEGGRLQLELQDDGRGFDPSASRVGRGVDGLHARARALGGTLSIASAPDRGTQVRLAAPL
jgi:signal transduction histidine kinase